MSRKDLDDEYKMTHLLQFHVGEEKETVAGLETVEGRVQQAMQILEKRYG